MHTYLSLMVGSVLRIVDYAIQEALNLASLYGCIGTYAQLTSYNVCHFWAYFRWYIFGV